MRNCACTLIGLFAKMASSQRIAQLMSGKTIRSQTKCVLMNVWDYFERESKKTGRPVNITQKIAKATGK